MIKEIIESYEGNSINPLGKPYVILIGFETDDNMACEIYIIYENSNGTYKHCGRQINSQIMVDEFDSLHSFIKEYGFVFCVSKIFNDVERERGDINTDIYLRNEINDSLRKVNISSLLTHLRMEAPRQLDWIEGSTSSNTLREHIILRKKQYTDLMNGTS